MGLFKKCLSCNNKGFLLKTSNGLCENCSSKLVNIESAYTDILKNLSVDSENRKKYISNLVLLINDINQFKSFSSVLDYNFALTLINENIIGNENIIENEIKIEDKPIVDSAIPKIIPNTMKIVADAEEKNFKNKPLEINNEKIEKTDVNVEPINTIENIVVKESDCALSNITLSLDENTSHHSELTLTEVDEHITMPEEDEKISFSDKLVIDELYENASKLITSVNNNTLNLNELGKTFFLIKDDYLPLLNDYKISEINGVNINTFLQNLEKKLVLLTSTSKENLNDFFNYIALSIQTSGNNKTYDYILEISAMKISFGNIIDEFYTLVNPVKTIKSNISSKTGITNAMISDSPTIDTALLNLKDFLGNFELITYNSPHTIGFLNNDFKSKLNMSLSNKESCLLRLYRIRYRDYHGFAPKVFDMFNICKDLLPDSEINEIQSFNSTSKSSCLAIYKLYETLKYKYK